MARWGKSDAEKAAERAQRDEAIERANRELREVMQGVNAEHAAKQRQQDALEAERRERETAAYRHTASSLAEEAAAAHERGETYFEVQAPVLDVGGVSVFGSVRARVTPRGGRTEILREITSQGWDLIDVGYVFVETGSSSTNNWLRTGEGTVNQGVTMAIYLFRSSQKSSLMIPSRSRDESGP